MILDLILVHFFSLSNLDWGKNTIIFWVNNTLSVHVDNKEKDILVLCEGPAQEFSSTTITEKAKYSIDFSRAIKTLCLNLYYNESTSFLNVCYYHGAIWVRIPLLSPVF